MCRHRRARVKFTPKVAGKYRVRITDARALGGPAYVYRLTVTTANVPEFHFPLKAKPDGLKDADRRRTGRHRPGRAQRPDRTTGHRRRVEARTEEGHEVHLRPASAVATSRRCAAWSRFSTRAARNWRRPKRPRPPTPRPLAFAPPADGTYTVKVTEKFRGRGGANFVYRLRVLDGRRRSNPASGSPSQATCSRCSAAARSR